MARCACTEFGADWVINNDADEFWWPEHGDLKQVLREITPSCAGVAVERTNFLPRPMLPGEFFSDVMTVRERHSLNALGKPLPAKVCHRAFADIEVGKGNHMARRNGEILPATSAPIAVLHFPMRSYHQFANKITKAWPACARNPARHPDDWGTWRHLYEIWQKGALEAFYRAAVLHPAAVEQGLKDGRLIFDDRLKAMLSRLRCRHPGHA
jgi:hypothetical protein